MGFFSQVNKNLDYSSRPDITSKADALQLMWDTIFPMTLYLFKNGIEFAPGWAFSGRGNAIKTINALRVSYPATGNNTNLPSAIWGFNKQLDVSGFIYIKVKFIIVSANTNSNLDIKVGTVVGSTGYNLNGTNVERELIVNISGINGLQDIKILMSPAWGDVHFTIDITEVILLPQ